MNTIYSKSSMDRSNWIKTTILILLLFVICLFIYYKGDMYVAGGFFLFFLLLTLVIYVIQPTYFALTSDELVMSAPCKSRVLNFNEIASFRLIEKNDKRALIRSFGSSGIFGDLGYYSSRTIRTMKVFARRNNNWILITTHDRGNYVIAPDDPEFINYMTELIINKKKFHRGKFI